MKSNPEVVDSRIFSMRSIRCVFWLQKSAFFSGQKLKHQTFPMKLIWKKTSTGTIMNKHPLNQQIKSSNQILMIRETPLKRKSTKLFRGVFFFPPNPPFFGPHLTTRPPRLAVDLCQVSDSSGLVGDLAEAKVAWNSMAVGDLQLGFGGVQIGWEWGLRFLLVTRWWNFTYFWTFHPDLIGEDEPNFTSIFFKWVGWNHHLVIIGIQIPRSEPLTAVWQLSFYNFSPCAQLCS